MSTETKVLKILGEFPSGPGLPEVTEADNGKTLGVKDGKWAAVPFPTVGSIDYPEYEGSYEVTPSAEAQTLETADKVLKQNIEVKKIPYAEVLNDSGGNTVTIG